MSLKRFIVVTVLCIAMTSSTQALESAKQRKAGCEISTFHDEEGRFQFVIVRFWQSNIDELWVCDAGLDLNEVFEELQPHRQRGKTSHWLEPFCNKTLPGLNKLEITETLNDTMMAEVVNALNETKGWKDMCYKYIEKIKYILLYIRKGIEKFSVIGVILCTLLFLPLLSRLYNLYGSKLKRCITRKPYKIPTIPLSTIYTKKFGAEECLLIDKRVLLSLNNLNTHESHNDSTSIGVIESNEDHDDIQINQAAIIPKLHSLHQDVINLIHEASTSRRPHLLDKDVTNTNQIVIEANHEASTSRKPHSSSYQDVIDTNQTVIETNHETSTSRKPHSSDQDTIYTNQTVIEVNHKASISRKPHPPYQVSTNRIGGLEKKVDLNRRTNFISFDQASCNLASNMVDDRQSTCSSDISFLTVSVCDYDFSSLAVSYADSGCLDDPIELDEDSSSEQGLLDGRFNREYM